MQAENLSLFEVKGFSMWQFLRAGEKLIIKNVPVEDLGVGDIILYRKNNELVCHRLVKKALIDKKEYMLYSRGDNSISLPELVTREMFLGIVMGILRKGKVVSLSSRKQKLINRVIVMIEPLILRILKPCYIKFRNLLK